MKRTFIAIDPSKKVKRDLEKIQKELEKHKIKGRFVNPENSHLTLVFLGWTREEKIGRIKDTLASAVAETPSLTLRFTQLNCFPKTGLAKTLYWSLEKNKDLDRMVLKIQAGLRRHKIWFDQKIFISHLTVARFRSPHNLDKKLPLIRTPETDFQVKQVTLYESRLSRAGPAYTPLKAVLIK